MMMMMQIGKRRKKLKMICKEANNIYYPAKSYYGRKFPICGRKFSDFRKSNFRKSEAFTNRILLKIPTHVECFIFWKKNSDM